MESECSGVLLARAPTRPSSPALLYIPVVVAGTIGRTSEVAELVLVLTRTVCGRGRVSDGEGMYGVWRLKIQAWV